MCRRPVGWSLVVSLVRRIQGAGFDGNLASRRRCHCYIRAISLPPLFVLFLESSRLVTLSSCCGDLSLAGAFSSSDRVSQGKVWFGPAWRSCFFLPVLPPSRPITRLFYRAVRFQTLLALADFFFNGCRCILLAVRVLTSLRSFPLFLAFPSLCFHLFLPFHRPSIGRRTSYCPSGSLAPPPLSRPVSRYFFALPPIYSLWLTLAHVAGSGVWGFSPLLVPGRSRLSSSLNARCPLRGFLAALNPLFLYLERRRSLCAYLPPLAIAAVALPSSAPDYVFGHALRSWWRHFRRCFTRLSLPPSRTFRSLAFFLPELSLCVGLTTQAFSAEWRFGH